MGNGLQRPALKRGQSSANLDELVKKLTQEPIPLLGDAEDTSDLTSAIAKLNSGSILHTEKRAIERLLAQRYEEALAAAAAAEQEPEVLGGGSDILRQVLYVFRSNNLATELDRSVQQQPADWRVRTHKARRRAFLVVRSLVRLKREVKRLGTPFHDLGWLMPVAAQERWGELKALAAHCRQLEAAVLDADVAINQLTALKEMQSKAAAPAPGTAGRANGRASPSRGALRSSAGRVSGTGGFPGSRVSTSGGRAVSESGAVQSRGRLRTPLTADPPPPPTAGVRGGRLANTTQPGAAPSSPLRSPMTGLRQTFITNHDKDAHSAVGALPPVAGRPAHSALSDAADTFLNTDGVTFSASGAPPPGSPNLAAHRPLGPAVQGSESALMMPSATAPVPLPTANGSSTLRPRLSVPGMNGAAPADSAAASLAPALPCLIQDGENLDQALARFKLAADDARNALVDTSRQFRAVLDLCNSHWPDQRWWLAAHTQDEAALDSWPTSDEFVVNRADVVRCLKAGAVAFQFMCYEDEPVTGPTGNRFDLWTTDPWELAADLAPEKVSGVQPAQPPHPLAPKPAANGSAANGSSAAAAAAHSERLVGMPLGVRILQQLANSVAEAAGPVALENLPIILHVSERQQEAIVADLLQYSIYRRLRKNLYIVVQRSHPVMRYDPECHAFVPAEGEQPTYSPGTGFSMLQLVWGGHALFVNDAGELERLPHSLMKELRTRRTEWFVSRTCTDLALLLEDGALDMRSLANVSYMWNQPHMRYSLAVETACTYVNHRSMIAQHGSVLLCRKPKVLGMVMGRLDGAVRVDRYGGGTKAQLPVVELLTCELNSAHMQHELAEVASARSTTTSVGLGRYVFRFEVLDKLLTGPTVLRPKLLPVVDAAVQKSALKSPIEIANAAAEAAAAGGPTSAPAAAAAAAAANSSTAMAPFSLPGGISESLLAHAASQGMDTVMLRLHLSMTDLTMHHAIKVVALRANRPPILIKGKEDGEALVNLLSKSDVDLKTATQRLAAKLPSFSRQQKPGQDILVFVQDNGVSLTATNVAAGLARRERGDRIHLVTVVASDAQRGEGNALLERMMKAFRTQADVMTHVLDQEGRGLLECVADVVHQYNEMLLSSVALSIMRTFQLPVILVTANTRNYLKRGGDSAVVPGKTVRPSVGGVGGAPTSSRLACMAVVERHSRPMMHHLAKLLLEPSLRQDTLALAQLLPPGMAPGNKDHDPTCIQAVALKTLMANFETIAAANDFHTPAKALVQGEWHNALCAAARDTGSQLLALQLAPGTTRSLSPMLLQLVRSCPCPVLVYPERVMIPGTGLLVAEADAQ
eukprot:XP_001696866.1 predicted protein [Chlamydomonas reinhardtii]